MSRGHEVPAAAGVECPGPERSGPECVERPLFTCGMVLSDADLTALVEWARARLGLQRFRTGWGVVCGLDVRCDPERAGWVRVESGVAVVEDGQDVVVGEPISVDLTGCCAVASPCAAPQPAKEVDRDACGDVVVDLVLSAEDAPTGTDLAGGCTCGCTPATEHMVLTRVRERARIHARPVAMPAVDPALAAAQRRQAAYSECHRVVERYVKAGRGERSPDEVIDWLGGQDLDPPCGWWETTCEDLRASDAAAALDAAVARALLDLVVDYRHRLVRRACASCECEDRIRLARVWLRRPDKTHDSCRVVRIDAYPPYRRELGPCTGPVPPGSFDLTPFLWQRWQQICTRWRTLAGDKRVQKLKVPTTTENLLALLEGTDRMSWDCADNAPVPVVVPTACLGERVLGFAPRPTATRTRRKAGP